MSTTVPCNYHIFPLLLFATIQALKADSAAACQQLHMFQTRCEENGIDCSTRARTLARRREFRPVVWFLVKFSIAVYPCHRN
jgi:hypothetical protein